jgi:hypothetical protein
MVFPYVTSLVKRQEAAAARRADFLIVFDWAVYLVINPEFVQDMFKIIDVQLRSERLAAATARYLRAGLPCAFVEPDPKMEWTLKDMKQFAERQGHQQDDDRGGVHQGDESKPASLQPVRADRESQA